jgi:hypothetical protein
MNAQGTRSRIVYALSAVAIVASGLLWRSHLLPLSPFMRKYGGDALWAMLVFVLIRFLRPRSNVMLSAVGAFAFAVAVEVSQLYPAPWIETIRGFRLGSLILGNTFNWPDIPAYAAGILVGSLIDRISVAHWRNPRAHDPA